MGLSHTVSVFQSKIANFSYPRVFNAPHAVQGLLFKLGNTGWRNRKETRNWATRPTKKFDTIFSRLEKKKKKSDTIHECYRKQRVKLNGIFLGLG